MGKFIQLLEKSNTGWLNIAANVYNLLHYNNAWKYRRHNTINFQGAFLKNCRFMIKGKNNTIILGAKGKYRNCTFTIIGNDCKIDIGSGDSLNLVLGKTNVTLVLNADFWCEDDRSSIIIGSNFVAMGGHVASTEGESIVMGKLVGFAKDVDVRNGDSHSIINTETRKRINYARPVVIGDHVWVTEHVRILKGAVIPSDTVIGNSSIVSTKLEKENALYAGAPAKVIKENINWSGERLK